MTARNHVGVRVEVLPDSDEDVAKVVDVLARAATGLAMDGISANVRLTAYEHDPDEEVTP
jgi:hypothetical protein